jgi:hypothetical protein
VTPEERRETIQRLAAERRQEAVRLRSQGPSCLYCVHGPDKPGKGTCNHPLFWQMNGNPAAGSFSARSLISTGTARAESGLCGPEAELFEPRNVASRVWRSLKPYLWP